MFLRIFFPWKLIRKSQADTEGNELSNHMHFLWSQYITTITQKVDDNGNNVSDIKGNLTVFDHSSDETNINSSNTYNNNSTRITSDASVDYQLQGVTPTYTQADDQREEEIPWKWNSRRCALIACTNCHAAKLRCRPPKPVENASCERCFKWRLLCEYRPINLQLMPQQASSVGGHVTNIDSFNMSNTHMNDVFNDNSQTYCSSRSKEVSV
ncbi:hypothetical protein BYT27DRAFT_7248510 [Phlegmacium glaucopus]|nr:hypothetical protein BYT27DRAFT_7248510 [Phlegmacium glaucopus]